MRIKLKNEMGQTLFAALAHFFFFALGPSSQALKPSNTSGSPPLLKSLVKSRSLFASTVEFLSSREVLIRAATPPAGLFLPPLPMKIHSSSLSGRLSWPSGKSTAKISLAGLVALFSRLKSASTRGSLLLAPAAHLTSHSTGLPPASR